MDRMGLTTAQLQAYHRALCAPHSVRIMVSLCDLDEKPREAITPVVLSGQVTYDVTSEVSRMLSMQFLDPRHQLNVDTEQPSDGALFLDRIVKVYYSVWVEQLGRHVTCQVFTGVPWKLTREGALVTVEAHGKERFALRPTWRAFHRAKGDNTVQVLEEYLRNRAGETRFAFPKVPANLGRPFTVGRQEIMWERAQKLAQSVNRQLFYDGRGRCVLRRAPERPVLAFRAGPGGSMVDDLAIDTEVSDFINAALVKGKKKLDPVAVTLDKTPLSPKQLTRGGVPGVIAAFEDNAQLKTRAQMRRRGQAMLERRGQTSVNVSYAVLPFPHLDENDMVRAVTVDGRAFTHRMRNWALPLATDGSEPMTVGYDRRLMPARGRIRRR